MPNSQKGFVIPLVIAIVAILAIGGTVYLTTNEKVEAPVVIDMNVPAQATTTKPVIITSTSTPQFVCKSDKDCREITCPATGGFAHELCVQGKCVIPADAAARCTATTSNPIACTMDAFMCSDGTYVGRSGPNCQFVCPVATSSNTESKIGQTITIDGLQITPVEVTGDSRCPRATKCVWAGTVNLTVRLQGGDMVQKAELTLGENFRFDNKIVTLTKVTPEKTFVQIQPSDYNFSFVVSSI